MIPCHSRRAALLLVSLLVTTASARLVFLGQQPFRAYVSRATPPRRTLYQFFAIEEQTGSLNGISYSTVGDSATFSLNSVSGLLLITETLPLSGPTEYTLVVRASSPGQATAAANIRIIVIPESDLAPRFEHSQYQVSISEALPVSRPFAVIRAFVPTGSVIQHYSLFESNTNSFAINSNTGLLRIETPLDRERTSSYSLTVRFVEDRTSVDVNVEVSIEDENDNAPQFSQMLYNVTIREDVAVNSLVVSASATDPDFEANGTVSYFLDGSVSTLFRLDQNTGEIHTAASLDYEQQNQHQFRVTALDGGNPSMNSTVTVFVNLINVDDECPRFESPIFFQEVECNPGRCALSVGMTILTVVASDPDGFSGVTYAIMSGNEDGVLALDPTTGVVTLARVVDSNTRGKYTLNVSASDLSCINQSFVPVEIGIGNVNNFSPRFTRPCTAELEENPPINTEVVTLVATDDDINDVITYSLVSSTDLFHIDSSGVVRTTAPPEMYDRENRAQFQVGVTASDRGNRKDYCILTVTLLDQNDNAPSFRFPDYNETESITLPTGAFITKVQADDVDLGSNGMVQYSLDYPVSLTDRPFTIDSQTGIITTNETFSQIVTLYRFLAVATDSGTTPQSSVVDVTVTLINSNEFPVFDQQRYSETICENTQFFSTIAFVRATSVRTEPIIYSILLGTEYHSNQDGIFQAGTISQNGSVPVTVSSAAVVDYERLAPGSSFSFYISALNSAGSSQVQMEVSVGDQDDNPPVFVSPDLTYSIVEGMPSGTIVAQLQASDSDSGLNGAVEYRLHITNFNHPYFTVHINGTIRSKMVFDAESMPPELPFYVEAYNPNAGRMSSCGVVNNFTTVALVRVRILDLNDNPPSFSPDVYICNVLENETVHSRIFALSSRASDPDRSDSGRLSFFIFSGNDDDIFVVDSSDLILARGLDYEVRQMYVVVVRVTDGVYTASATINVRVIDVDDEPPVFSARTYFGRVIENAVHGTNVLNVSASDVDSPSILYQLQGLAIGRFSIDGSGAITVAGSVDREEFPGGEIVFLVFAYGGSLATANVRVSVFDVNDYTPRFVQSFIGRIQENRAPGGEGLLVGVAQAVDLDEGRNGTVTYSLLSGGDQGFQIDASTGTLTAHREYNREAMLFYVLNILAMDDGIPTRLSSAIEITIEIGDDNDNKPFFPYPYMFTWVYEEASLGTVILTIPASDSDNGTNSTVFYTQMSSNPAEIKYDVIANTGEVRVDGNLNYEIPQHRVYLLTISLNDSSFQSDLNGCLEIHLLDRNDNQPVARVNYNINSQLSETLPAETHVATVMATDDDSGRNGELLYFISAGNTNGDFNVSNDGQIKTTRLLDRERTAVYNLTVTVSDQGDPPLSTIIDVNFEVTDLNDEPPVFSEDPYMVNVPENSGPISSILAVSASDPDSGAGGVVGSYFIVGGNEEGEFALDPFMGVLETRVSLDREQQSQYTLTVVATDRGLQQITGTGTVIITVTDVNDNPSSDGGHTQVLIYALDGHLATGNIAPLYFSDPDVGDSFQNCITNTQTPQGTFDVDVATCTLRLTQDNPGEGAYFLQVTGTDGVHDSVIATVNITVENRSVALENVLTITVNVSAQTYIENLMSHFPALISTAVGSDITVVSVGEGYHSPTSTVDVSFYARRSDGSFLSPTAMLQDLYLQRDALRIGDYSVHALPTDACAGEPCLHQATCRTLRMLRNSQVVANTRQTILVAPQIQLDHQCQCIPGTTGELCEVNFDDCYSNPCHYGAQCTDRIQGFTCDCPQGTSGPNCSVNPDECSSSPCQNGATCRNGLDTHVCDCPPGYYGTECQYHYFRQSSACDSSPCLNGAECSPGRDSYTCLCPRNFTGQRCDQSVLVQGGCIGNPCYNGSTCTDTPTGPICTCSIGFTGPFCRWPLDNCELEPCRNGGTCLRGFYGSYRCMCAPGYTGENCTQLIPGCDSDPCLNGGRCFNTEDGSYSCECTRQFYGNNCEFSIQPQDLCATRPCAPTGNCTYGRDSFTCTCDPTTSGTSCAISSPPATPCDSNPCLHGSTCTTSTMSYTCTCSPGFSGMNCEVNVDDCASSPCVNGGRCTDGVNGFICNCPEQITGRRCEIYCPDGQRGEFCQTTVGFCTLTACMNAGTCIEGAAGFSCVCPSSHTGPNCDTDNSCVANPCLNGGTCVNSTSGGSECLCGGDFDGERCELAVVSFYGSQTESSYRAFDSLDIRGQGTLNFQFATRDSSGLLLYNTQFQGGTSRDYIAVEVVSGRLSVGVSQGADSATAVVMSSAVQVNDGLWHQVNIETSGKVSEYMIHAFVCVCNT